MFRKLINLSNCLNKIGHRDLSNKILSMAAEISSGSLPDFDWIKSGSIFGTVAQSKPGWFEDFLNFNSDQILKILGGAQVTRYLGSGATGDAWLLSNGNVLKLFDANAKVRSISGGSKSALDDAKLVEEVQWSGKADPSQPRIYDYGVFNYDGFSDEFEKIKSPSRFSTGSFQPAYIIMESVKTTDSTMNEYIQNNPEQMSTSIDVVDPDEIEGSEQIENMLQPSEVPQPLMNEYLDSISSGEYEYFLHNFRKYMNEKIHESIMDIIWGAWEEWHEWNNMTEEEQEQNQEPSYDFNNEESIEELVDSAVYSIEIYSIQNYHWYELKSLKKYEEILSLKPGWDRKLIKAMIKNIKMGRSDVHGGNWGFRGDQPVFFDA